MGQDWQCCGFIWECCDIVWQIINITSVCKPQRSQRGLVDGYTKVMLLCHIPNLQHMIWLTTGTDRIGIYISTENKFERKNNEQAFFLTQSTTCQLQLKYWPSVKSGHSNSPYDWAVYPMPCNLHSHFRRAGLSMYLACTPRVSLLLVTYSWEWSSFKSDARLYLASFPCWNV